MANSVHPTAQVNGDVRLGSGNTIGPFVVITGPVTIGDDNWIGTGVVIGAPPEVRDWPHPREAADPVGNGIEIGNRNVIREYAQIHHGWHDVTTIGDDAFIMNQCYVAHDCHVGDRATFASSVLLAGHVHIGEDANLGLGSSVHQRRRVGPGAMVGMGSVVTRDVVPFAKAFGNPCRFRGVNRIGMQRKGIANEAIDALEEAYGEHGQREALGSLDASDFGAAFQEWIAD
jgi:UDP-N-acetylglucosamine acyltransferase